jgi:hypothetical protein
LPVSSAVRLAAGFVYSQIKVALTVTGTAQLYDSDALMFGAGSARRRQILAGITGNYCFRLWDRDWAIFSFNETGFEI